MNLQVPPQSTSSTSINPVEASTSQVLPDVQTYLAQMTCTLGPEEKSEILRNPYSPRSTEILTPLMLSSSLAEGVDPALVVYRQLTPANQTPNSLESCSRWDSFCTKLIEDRVNPLLIDKEAYWDYLRSAAGFATDQLTTELPYAHTIARLMEVRDQMLLLTRAANITPMKENTPIMELRDELHRIIGTDHNFDSGVVEFTPFGILIYASRDMVSQFSETAIGFNHRALTDPSWNGLISFMEASDLTHGAMLSGSELDIREHELRHASQIVLNRPRGISLTSFPSQLFAALSSATDLVGMEYVEHIKLRVNQLTTEVVNRMLASSSDEITAYLSGNSVHRPLTIEHLGITHFPELLATTEDYLWHCPCSALDKQSIYQVAAEEIDRGNDLIIEAQALVELLVSKGVARNEIRGAFELHSLRELDTIAALFDIKLPEVNSRLSQKNISANNILGAPYEALSNLRTFLHLKGSTDEWQRTYESLYRAIASNKELLAQVESNSELRSNSALIEIQSGNSTSAGIPTEVELKQLIEALRIPIAEASSWSRAVGGAAAVLAILSHIDTTAIIDPDNCRQILDSGRFNLRMQVAPIPPEILDEMELLACKAQFRILRVLSTLSDSDTRAKIGSVYYSLENLIDQIHRRMDQDYRFMTHATDVYLDGLVGSSALKPPISKETAKQIIILAPQKSQYLSLVDASVIESFNTAEDLPYLIFLSRDISDIARSYLCCTKAFDTLSIVEDSPERSEFATALIKRITLLREILHAEQAAPKTKDNLDRMNLRLIEIQERSAI